MTSILVGGLVAGLVIVAGVVIGAMLAWRALERRVELLCNGDLWTNRKMWRTVAGAEDAVRRCAKAGAPVGDLPGLCRRLRSVAGDVERTLRLGAVGSRRQAAEVMVAARDVRGAAAAAMADLSAPRARALAADAEREVRSISAGLDASRQLID